MSQVEVDVPKLEYGCLPCTEGTGFHRTFFPIHPQQISDMPPCRLQIDPDLSWISNPLQSEQRWQLKNEPVSTDVALLIVADHIPSLYLDGEALGYSLHPNRSTWGTCRNYTPRPPTPGLYAEIICRQ